MIFDNLVAWKWHLIEEQTGCRRVVGALALVGALAAGRHVVLFSTALSKQERALLGSGGCVVRFALRHNGQRVALPGLGVLGLRLRLAVAGLSCGGLLGLWLWRALDHGGQATKGTWGMSWRQEARKGVEVCEKLGGGDKQPWIPGCPNAVC